MKWNIGDREMAKKIKEKFAVDTSQRTLKEWIKAIAVPILGLIIAHLGVTLFILSDMGTDPYTLLITGITKTIQRLIYPDIIFGAVHMGVTFLLMGIMILTTKGYVKPGTVVCTFLGGPIIEIFKWLLKDHINADSSVLVRTISMVLGCIILAAGMSIVINSRSGTGSNDLVAIILSDKIPNIEFRWIRIVIDFTFVIVGYVLGGRFGVGTLVAVLLVGPFAQFWLPKTRVLTRYLISENEQ